MLRVLLVVVLFISGNVLASECSKEGALSGGFFLIEIVERPISYRSLMMLQPFIKLSKSEAYSVWYAYIQSDGVAAKAEVVMSSPNVKAFLQKTLNVGHAMAGGNFDENYYLIRVDADFNLADGSVLKVGECDIRPVSFDKLRELAIERELTVDAMIKSGLLPGKYVEAKSRIE